MLTSPSESKGANKRTSRPATAKPRTMAHLQCAVSVRSRRRARIARVRRGPFATSPLLRSVLTLFFAPRFRRQPALLLGARSLPPTSWRLKVLRTAHVARRRGRSMQRRRRLYLACVIRSTTSSLVVGNLTDPRGPVAQPQPARAPSLILIHLAASSPASAKAPA